MMPNYQGISNLLEELLDEIRSDTNISNELLEQIMNVVSEFREIRHHRSEVMESDINALRKKHDVYLQRLMLLNEISKKRYPSYVDEYIHGISSPPYTIPSSFYEPNTGEQVRIKIDSRWVTERADLALLTLFPGSMTFRYGTSPIKVHLGLGIRNGVAELKNTDILSEEPIFKIPVKGEMKGVFKPTVFYASTVTRPLYICRTCYSLSGYDERCSHPTKQRLFKLPSSYPIAKKVEIAREISDTQSLRIPMSALIEKVNLLSPLKVGAAVTGFERTLNFGKGAKTISIAYDPPIGMVLNTVGLGFEVRLPDDFVDEILKVNNLIRRDTTVMLLSDYLNKSMSYVGLPSYHHESILSALISSINLDSIVDEKAVEDALKSHDIHRKVGSAISHEMRLSEGSPPESEKIQRVLSLVQGYSFEESDLCRHLEYMIIHSFAHLLLLSTSLASGTSLNDVDYLLKTDNKEVVVFDNVSGGNGASITAYEFLGKSGDFDVMNYITHNTEFYHRPRYLDETIFELLLPCVNGVADRIFLSSAAEPSENEFRNRLRELRKAASEHHQIAKAVHEHGVSSMFPMSIGYHSLRDTSDSRKADIFKLFTTTCLHGCPECISIGNKCHEGSIGEKYGVSKYALDEMLRYALKDGIVLSLSSEAMIEKLTEYGFAILSVSVDSKANREETTQAAQSLVSQLLGVAVGDGIVKYSGYWIDVNPLMMKTVYSHLLMVV